MTAQLRASIAVAPGLQCVVSYRSSTSIGSSRRKIYIHPPRKPGDVPRVSPDYHKPVFVRGHDISIPGFHWWMDMDLLWSSGDILDQSPGFSGGWIWILRGV